MEMVVLRLGPVDKVLLGRITSDGETWVCHSQIVKQLLQDIVTDNTLRGKCKTAGAALS